VEAGISSYDGDDAEDHLLQIPVACPECGSALEMDGKYLVCRNSLKCPAQIAGAIKRWIKKVGILDWGGSVIEALCEQGLVSGPADLYELEDDVLSEVQLSGRRVGSSAKRMLDNLHAKKELPLHVVLGSLGIPFIGRSMAKKITDGGYDTLDKVFKATKDQIAAIPGVGSTKAEAFYTTFEGPGIELVCALLGAGVTIAKPVDGFLKGKTVCMSGTRDPALVAAIEGQGGTMKSGVSKKLDYLILKDPSSTSAKAKKARRYGIEILGIDDMWALLGR